MAVNGAIGKNSAPSSVGAHLALVDRFEEFFRTLQQREP
jgi:hypothetical protein